MQMHEPNDEFLIEEFREIVRSVYGGKRSGPEPGEKFLVNVERMVKLHAIVRNPYHDLVFDGMSTLALMRVCARHLMENLDYRHAFKALRDIDRIERIERQAQATGQPEASPAPGPAPGPRPTPAPEPRPEPVYRLDPEAMPAQPPPLTEEQVYLRSLSDRELARQYKIDQRREAERSRAERDIERQADAGPAAAASPPADLDQRRGP